MKQLIVFGFFCLMWPVHTEAGCLNISVGSQKNVICFSGTSGSCLLLVSGGSSPYNYSWSNGQTGATASGLSTGTYSCTVTDAGLCKDSIQITITEPFAALAVGIIPQNASCGNSNGSINTAVTGGTIPYTYSWSNAGVSGLINGLSPAIYTVTVTDKNGCTSSASSSVVNLPGPVLNIIATVNPSCFGGTNGYAVVGVSSGTPNFIFDWSTGQNGSGSKRSDTLFNLSAGTFSLDVTDANSCFDGISFSIGQPTLLTCTATSLDGTCGNSDGSATAFVSGGSPGYTYIWSTGDTINSALTSDLLSPLASGSYSVTVYDNNGCSSTNSVSVNNQRHLSIVIGSQTDVSCSGNSDGSVTIMVTSGTPAYTYSWLPSAGTGAYGVSSVQISNLASGTYTVTVQDNASCTETAAVSILQPFKLSANITYSDASCGISNGLVNAGGSGGTSPYVYFWSNDSTSQIIKNLGAGNYRVTVTDRRGCTSVDSAIILNTSLPVASASANPSGIVSGSTVELSGSGGSSFQWLPGLTVTCSSCPNTAANPLETTTYTLVATDNFGCSDTAKVTVTVKPACIGDESDVFIANVFSPNGDGKNDIVKVEGNGLGAISWSIFDRWGNLLFYSENQSEGWDGTSGGKALENGTYVYLLQATCLKSKKGITLKGNISIVK